MRFAIALFCFIALAYGQCTYSTYDPSTSLTYNYDLSSLALSDGAYAYSFSDWNNSKYWIFNVCGNLDSAYNPYTYSKVDCADDSAVCYQYTYNSYATYTSVGTYSSAVYTDSMYGAGQGVAVTYQNNQLICGYSYAQSRFEFVCDASSYSPFVTSVQSSWCYDVITVHTAYACPTSGSGAGTGATEIGTGFGTGISVHPNPGHHIKKTMPVGKIVGMAIGSFVGAAILCTICVVCCVRRQQRCQQQRNQCQELKNVSYSPVPQQQPQQQPQPYMQPQFVAPQQYPAPSGPQAQIPYPYPQYYFYAQPQQAVKPQPAAEPVAPLVKLEEVDNDEQLAKQLQAQFDKEGHN